MLKEWRQTHEHLQIVAHRARQLTIELTLAARQHARHKVERRARLVYVRARAIRDRVQQLEQIDFVVFEFDFKRKRN